MDLSKILTRDLDKFIKNYLLPDRGLLAAKEEEADTLLEPAALWPLALLSPPSLTMGLSKILARDLDKFIENYLLPDRGLLAAEKEEADTLLELEALWPLALLSPPSLTMDLSKIPARDLDKFIENYLLPDTRFREEVRQAIDIICAFLKEMCFLQAADLVRVSKVVKGGSLGKGTTLKGRSDADLVVFLSHLRSFQEQFDRRKEFIQEIRRHLEACQEIYKFAVTFEVQNPRRDNPRALSFVLRSPLLHSDVEFDVLPAFDVLGQVPRSYSSDSQIAEGYRPHPQIYIKLIQECEKLGKEGEFSSCFTELQRGFLKQRPTKVKSLVRLVKHWYQKCKEKLGKPLPQQYALELLTVYAWERGCKETYFKTAQGFQTVLKLVQNYKKLCIYWEKYYDFDNPVIAQYLRKQLRKPRPVILDPADPTGNLGGGDSQSWPRLAREAEAWLSYPCFKNADGSPVGSWYIELEEDSEDALLFQLEEDSEDEYWIDECEQHCGHFQQYHTPLYNTPHYNAPRYNAPRYDTPCVDENQWCVIL